MVLSQYRCRRACVRGLLAYACLLFSIGFGTSTVHAATSTVVYASDFSSDPEWITDQPQNFYWDADREMLFARTMNEDDSTYYPSRHYYIETDLNPARSYELSWDMYIDTVKGGNGVAVFGIYGDRLHAFNQFTINIDDLQDGTFTTRMMTLTGSPRHVFTDVNPGGGANVGEYTLQPFRIGLWYHLTERYDAPSLTYHFEIKERDSGAVILTKSIQAYNGPVNPELQNLGISMHPESWAVTNLSLTDRVDDYTEYLIDNVRLIQINDELFLGKPSVLFLPGIQASRLYTNGVLGSEDRLWEPNINGDVAQLEMTEGGESVSDIYTRDSIDAIFGTADVYGDFEAFLATLKAENTISDWETYAYDWRYSVADIVRDGTKYEEGMKSLVDTLESLTNGHDNKVVIVGHSNGGLLAKALMHELEVQGKAKLVESVILVAVPQLGTPKAIGALIHGYDQEQLGGLVIDDETAREVMRYMPGVYGLLPSVEYLKRVADPVITFSGVTTTKQFIDAYGSSVDTKAELTQFLTGEGDGRVEATSIGEAARAHGAYVTSEGELHDTMLDPWVAPEGVSVFQIVGTGLNTVRAFAYEEFVKKTCVSGGGPGSVVCAYDPYYEPVPRFTPYGDETVVATSAVAYAGDATTYYIDLDEVRTASPVDLKVHSDIMGLESLQQLIGGIVQETTVQVPFIYSTAPSHTEAQELIAVHSPVTLILTDSAGRRVEKLGSGTDSRIITDVPGSTYTEVGGGTYVIVPASTEFTVTILGTGAGSYTLTRDQLRGGDAPVRLSTLNHATATPTMRATFSKKGGIYSDLSIDYDNNGTIDEIVTLDGELPTTVLYSNLHALMSTLVLIKESERAWLQHAVDRAQAAGIRKGDESRNVARIFAQMDDRLRKYVVSGLVPATTYDAIAGIMSEIMSR